MQNETKIVLTKRSIISKYGEFSNTTLDSYDTNIDYQQFLNNEQFVNFLFNSLSKYNTNKDLIIQCEDRIIRQ